VSAEPVSRRTALSRLAGWPAVIVALGGAGLAAVAFALRRSRRPRGVPITPLATVPPGSAFRTRYGESPIIVLNVGGEIRAFDAVCTHEGCPLGWNPEQRLIRCPCHGGAYDVSGKVVEGPPPAPLQRLEAAVGSGMIFVSRP
jgi:nitrite reductase/ring-hydroxylating ferredoxin subunit